MQYNWLRARGDQLLRPCLLLRNEWQLPEHALAGLGIVHRTYSPPLLERPPTSRDRETAVTVVSKYQSYVVLNKSKVHLWEYCTYQVVVVPMLR